jgi:hypothetical protein
MSDNLTLIWDELQSNAVATDFNDGSNDISAILDPRRSKTASISGVTDGTYSPPKIIIDKGGTYSVAAVALIDIAKIGWVYPPPSAVVSACSNADGSGVLNTTTIDWPDTTYASAPDGYYADTYPSRTVAWAEILFGISARYWTVEWPDVPDGVSMQVGRIMLGELWRPSHNIGFGWKATPVDPSTVMRSIGGQRWTDARDTYMQIAASFRHLDEDEAYGDILPISMLAARDPCVLSVSPGTALSSVLDLYGYMSPVAVTHAGAGRFEANINFEEAL